MAQPKLSPHQVLTQWPALEDPENGITTVESLYEWAAAKGYDALEMSVDDIKKKFFPNTAPEQVDLDWGGVHVYQAARPSGHTLTTRARSEFRGGRA